jgi:hypothetical protein
MKSFFKRMGGYLIRLNYSGLVGMSIVAYIAAYNAAGQIPAVSPKVQATLGWLGVVGSVLSFFVQPFRADKNGDGIPDEEQTPQTETPSQTPQDLPQEP